MSLRLLCPSALQLFMSLCLSHNVCLHHLNHLCLLSPAESVPLSSFSRPRSPGPQPGFSASLSVSIFCLHIFLHPYLCLSRSCVCLHLSICLRSVLLGVFLPVPRCHSAIFLSVSVCLCTQLGICPSSSSSHVCCSPCLLRSLILGFAPQPHGCFGLCLSEDPAHVGRQPA